MSKKKIYHALEEMVLVTMWIIGVYILLRGIDIPSEVKSFLGLTFGCLYVKLDGIYEEVKRIRKQGDRKVTVKFDSTPMKLHSLQPEIDALNKGNEQLEAIMKDLKPENRKIK